MKKAVEEKRAEVRGALDAKDAEKAKALNEELRGLQDSLKIAEELEADEKRALENQKAKKEERGDVKVEKVSEMRAIVKSVMGKELSAEERAVIVSSDNSAVLPSQFVNQLQEIKKGFGSLKSICDVIPVTKNSGTIPMVDYDQNSLADIAEGADIVDGSLVTTDLNFTCSKVGLIQTLSSELVDDAEVEIESIARTNFSEIAVAKENKKIMTVIDTNATAVTTPTSYEDLENVMDTALPAVKSGLITLCNVAGYAYLKNKKDNQERPLNLITNVNGVEYFNNKPIITFDSSLVTPGAGMTKIFYSLNSKEAVKFLERAGVTVARSTEAGFNDDTIKLRILERLAVAKGSVRSVKKLELA
ncbi:phage major capsid protein, HK97 family [Clostridium pasteurianum DSM 525 = ATCC 6013]|uniref:Phage major capsid protein, HK97 family n=2 Tax=Clostridium pasteurianum TaxID=1501 RepID=A0A0H3J7T0_CLOPA|nr:phage major capsid protein, HK97 family [Clostridium pasteurianum DSM 525 = ATCC 6013]AOZ81182.1 capsid protein [Clostridium pasteurianum]AJA53522.1 phage major capsid protein, HK97 family [Clostridium pasteurianum DSM 525 = ATCC 6013]AOZ77386.1 capsid protein [Clostridium pasteurianum DSM 525 = ATCC 6013]KRU14453.1 phage major capsid protein, HK97 family [Clostridium pasteurianum DSM 525 = ATCC 6013]